MPRIRSGRTEGFDDPILSIARTGRGAMRHHSYSRGLPEVDLFKRKCRIEWGCGVGQHDHRIRDLDYLDLRDRRIGNNPHSVDNAADALASRRPVEGSDERIFD